MRSARQSATFESESWCRYFSTLAVAEDHLPWGHPTRLSGEEKHSISKSIQQFQLGESSSGRRLLQRGLAYSSSGDDPHFVSALSLFVKEEQRHSSRLLRFMQREGIPASRKHWVDTVFRHLRVLAGLELSLRVLVSAEIIAVPYYRALRAATSSFLLQAICSEILRDEAAHLRYQASMLSRLGAHRALWVDRIISRVHQLFLLATCYVVWVEHGQVFRAAGYSRQGFLTEAFWEFNWVDRAVCRRLLSAHIGGLQDEMTQDSRPPLTAATGIPD
jgi:hypothetical protein